MVECLSLPGSFAFEGEGWGRQEGLREVLGHAEALITQRSRAEKGPNEKAFL